MERAGGRLMPTGYSRGTQGVLKGYSRGTQGAGGQKADAARSFASLLSRTICSCSTCSCSDSAQPHKHDNGAACGMRMQRRAHR